MEQQLSEEEVQHPENWLKIEKLIDGVWVNTGWAEDGKAFLRHAKAIGGRVKATDEKGNIKWTLTEYVLSDPEERDIYVDSEPETCDTSCLEHS